MDYEKYIKIRELVLCRIEELLNNNDFSLDISYLRYIHGYLFKDIYLENGSYRTYNISRNEPILRGESIVYPDYHTIDEYLKYDFNDEKGINYNDLLVEEKVKCISEFTSRIWLIHPFGDGNTRTTSVFIIKYLRLLGYDVNNESFRLNSGYFRDALVRANYHSDYLNVNEDLRPLILFFNKIIIDNGIQLDDDLLYIKELYMQNDNVRKKKRIFYEVNPILGTLKKE